MMMLIEVPHWGASDGHPLNMICGEILCVYPLLFAACSWPQGYKTFFMLNSTEQEIFSANKSQITNNCKFFLDKHSWAWNFLC